MNIEPYTRKVNYYENDPMHGLYRAVNTVNQETPDNEGNDSSKHVELDKKL